VVDVTAPLLPLLLPVLIPSWRFFKTIEPSPRVQWAIVPHDETATIEWQDFHRTPRAVSPLQMARRLFWNARRNEELFVVSCAERIREQPTAHSIEEIKRRLARDIAPMSREAADQRFQFRLVFVHRDRTKLVQEIVFLSEVFPVTAPKTLGC